MIKAIWESNKVKTALKAQVKGPLLWNGDKIAWSSAQVDEIRISVDMDAERNRNPNPQHPNIHRFVLKPAKIIRLAVLNAFLARQTPFDNACLESISKFFSMLQHPEIPLFQFKVI